MFDLDDSFTNIGIYLTLALHHQHPVFETLLSHDTHLS